MEITEQHRIKTEHYLFSTSKYSPSFQTKEEVLQMSRCSQNSNNFTARTDIPQKVKESHKTHSIHRKLPLTIFSIQLETHEIQTRQYHSKFLIQKLNHLLLHFSLLAEIWKDHRAKANKSTRLPLKISKIFTKCGSPLLAHNQGK